MKINKSKLLLTSIFYLIVSLWSEPLCMEANKMTPIDTKDVKIYPHNAIVSLKCLFKGKNPKIGTGFLIHNNLVKTAAHLVFNDGERAYQIDCRIEKCGETCGGISFSIDKYIYATSYEKHITEAMNNYKESGIKLKDYLKTIKIAEELTAKDYALLYFAKGVDEGRTFIDPIFCKFLNTHDYWFCGYPGKEYDIPSLSNRSHRDGAYPYKHHASLSETPGEGIMRFKTCAYKGMSGGPIMFEDTKQNKWNAAAIMSRAGWDSSTGTKSVGCRFTEEKIQHIKGWQKYLLGGLEISSNYKQIDNGEYILIIKKQEDQDENPDSKYRNNVKNNTKFFKLFTLK